jgi:hypothetical protein
MCFVSVVLYPFLARESVVERQFSLLHASLPAWITS